MHPLDMLDYLPMHSPMGLRSRARQRAQEAGLVDRWANRAIAALRGLWRGVASEELLRGDAEGWVRNTAGGRPSQLALRIRGRVKESLARRPPDVPRGVAAVLRQQGLEAVPPGQGKARPGKMPRRGQVWPAVVDDIALPESFARVELMEVSETAASFLSRVEETMLRPAAERDAIRQAWE